MSEKLRLTPRRREVLERLAAGPKTIDEARHGRSNEMPQLLELGWAEYARVWADGRNYYQITDAGRRVLAEGERLFAKARREQRKH